MLPYLVVVGANVPAKSVKELIALAKAKPRQLNFASLGDGTAAHLAAEIFNRAAGIDVVHVPFKSIGDSYAAIGSGEVHYLLYFVASAAPLLQGGKARALAVTSKQRLAALPEVPTVAEAGLPAAETNAMLGIVGPAKMPRELVAKLHADIVAVLRRPETSERFATQTAVPTAETTPADYAARLKAEYESYRKLLAATGFKQQ